MRLARIILLIELISVCLPVLSQGQAIAPDPPVIKVVSLLNGSDSVYIEWTLSKDSNVASYVIVIPEIHGWSSGWVIADSSQSPVNTSYTFKYPAVKKDSVTFRMYAEHSAGHVTSRLLGNLHTTNFLSLTADTCNYTLHLKWSGYRGWGDSLLLYQLWIRAGSNPDLLYNAFIPGVDSTDYLIQKSDTNYSFVVKAINHNGTTSFSNKLDYSVHIPEAPSFINADYASVIPPGEIALSFSFDSSSDINNFNLYRSENETGPYSVIKSFSPQGSGSIKYVDPQADPAVKHFYKLAAVNFCGKGLKESNLAGNIVLTAMENGSEVNLSWNKYSAWTGGPGDDSLMRSKPEGGWDFVAVIPFSDTSYKDQIHALAYLNYKNKICYQLRAAENGLNPSGFQGISTSNTACVDIPPAVKIPTAFTPNDDNKNDEFKPLFDFTPDEYLLKIFDRNGNILFQTNIPSDSWNGTDSKGNHVLQGTYVYYLRYKLLDQKSRELRGTISVLYP